MRSYIFMRISGYAFSGYAFTSFSKKKTYVDFPSSFLKLKKAAIDLRGNQFEQRLEQIIERAVGEVTKY